MTVCFATTADKFKRDSSITTRQDNYLTNSEAKNLLRKFLAYIFCTTPTQHRDTHNPFQQQNSEHNKALIEKLAYNLFDDEAIIQKTNLREVQCYLKLIFLSTACSRT